MAGKKKKQIRTELRKNRSSRVRQRDWTQKYGVGEEHVADAHQNERVSGKSEFTRKRTVRGTVQEDAQGGWTLHREVDAANCLSGVVVRAGGLTSTVRAEDGTLYQCAVRRILKTVQTDQRHVVAAGDRVLFRPADNREGWIERVEPRHGVLCRTSRGRQQVIVANVDLLLIIASAAEPRLKPHLIDRLLVTAEQAGIQPVICINKMDLVTPESLQPIVGVYSQMGYRVLPLSATREWNIQRLRQCIADRNSVVVGQSGVGKSSLLNALDPDLALRVREVSSESEKGRHTTTAANLVALPFGGFIVDTPGIRQFQLWDIIPAEVSGLMRDIRPFINQCRFSNCTHQHEAACRVKDAVADMQIDLRRYDSYCQLFAGEAP